MTSERCPAKEDAHDGEEHAVDAESEHRSDANRSQGPAAFLEGVSLMQRPVVLDLQAASLALKIVQGSLGHGNLCVELLTLLQKPLYHGSPVRELGV